MANIQHDTPSWKQTKLSLERPYKDDNGNPIPTLFDIAPTGEQIYEPEEDREALLGERLRRIFHERGVDFFDRTSDNLEVLAQEQHEALNLTDDDEAVPDDGDAKGKTMSPEELFSMRVEILPQLFIALGEMSHARDLLTSLLSSQGPNSIPSATATTSTPTPTLSATVVTKPPAILSVRAFNAQLSIGGKDEALRKAADVFKSAADSMEEGRVRGEKYWVDALKIRRGNWGLIPAPLPFGSAVGKGSDKTSKDFWVSFGLEESPPVFRRRAVGHMAPFSSKTHGLLFPHRQYQQFVVSLIYEDASGQRATAISTPKSPAETTLEGSLKAAQLEIVEHEIFSLLVREAAHLPTASARVSERLIVIDAAQNMELQFELVDVDSRPSKPLEGFYTDVCDLIHSALYALLLRQHSALKTRRLGNAGVFSNPTTTTTETVQPPPFLVLQPIIDFLQYHIFCQRIKSELDKVLKALNVAGVVSTFRFDPVGEVGQQLVHLLEENSQPVTGEVILRIDNRHTIRLTCSSPSSLTAHLPQAVLAISSISQLSQLLMDEVEKCLLNRISDLGTLASSTVEGCTWFVDLNRCIGRWDGCVINFRISFGPDFAIECTAFRLDKTTPKQGLVQSYQNANSGLPLLSWVRQYIDNVVATR